MPKQVKVSWGLVVKQVCTSETITDTWLYLYELCGKINIKRHLIGFVSSPGKSINNSWVAQKTETVKILITRNKRGIKQTRSL